MQISFFSQVYDYFYQSVTDSLWKDDDSEKWVLNVESWLEEETYLRDRTSLREKIVGDVTEFESVDEAIRYAIDWVISFPTKDLAAQIQPIIPPYADLPGRINPFKIYSKSYDLAASTVPFHPRDLSARMRIIDEWADLTAQMRIYDYWGDLGASITGYTSLTIPIEFGASYTPGSGGDIDLDFS